MRWIVLHQLDVRQLRQPDLHRAMEQLHHLRLVVRIGDVHLVGDLVELGILPAREVHQVRAGHRDAAALIQPQRGVGLGDRRRHGRRSSRRTGPSGTGRRSPAAGSSTASTPWRFSISDSTGPIAGPAAPKPMMSSLSFLPCASAQTPAILLEALARQQRVALLRVERQGVVLRQQVLHRVEVGHQRRVGRQRQRRHLRRAEIADIDQLLPVDVVATAPSARPCRRTASPRC